MDDIRECFPDGKADDMNWLFLSTSGVHGSYKNLNDFENEAYRKELEEEDIPFAITVLVIRPRTVVALYGEIEVKTKEEVEFLRRLVRTTIKHVELTQRGNL